MENTRWQNFPEEEVRTGNTPTTPQEREKLFRIWEETGNVTEACEHTGISRGTFYYWKERFDEGGYNALYEERSRTPLQPHRTPAELEEAVVEVKRNHPTWGKLRITNHIKEIYPDATIAPNTVRRILVDAGLW